MTGLPAKYARMGFKRGWKAYRGSRSSSSNRSGAAPMARRRRSRTFARVSARSGRRVKHRRSSRGGGLGSWLPLGTQEMILDFGIGAATGPINKFLLPYQQQYLGMFGQYSDEAALAIVGSVAHHFGGGIVKDAGRELFRVAVISAGQAAGNQILGSMTGSSGAAGAGYL